MCLKEGCSLAGILGCFIVFGGDLLLKDLVFRDMFLGCSKFFLVIFFVPFLGLFCVVGILLGLIDFCSLSRWTLSFLTDAF